MFILGCNFSCSNIDYSSPESFLSYSNNHENGLKKNVVYKDINLSIKLIPSNYFLLKDHDFENLKSVERNRLKHDYEHSIYFILEITPNEKRDRIIDRQTYNVAEFKRKTQGLNFNLEQLVSLKIKDQEFFPVLSSLQNVYELEGSKSILLAYNLEDSIKEDVVVKFNDQIFTGETFEFEFRKSDINNIPQLTI